MDFQLMLRKQLVIELAEVLQQAEIKYLLEIQDLTLLYQQQEIKYQILLLKVVDHYQLTKEKI